MAKSLVGPGKKRHVLTLTESVVVRFQTICKDMNLPPATLSRAVDDFLREIVVVMETARRKGGYGIADMFQTIATQMELLEEGKRNGKPTPKAAAVAKRGRTKKDLGDLAELIRKT